MTTGDRSTERPAALLGRFVEAEVDYFAGHIDSFPAEEFLHPDFVLHEPESLPYGGRWHGRDGFRSFLRVMAKTWRTMGPKEPPVLVEQGDTVVVLATLRAETRATGRLVEPPVAQVVRVHDGYLTEARMFYWDTLTLTEAMGFESARDAG